MNVLEQPKIVSRQSLLEKIYSNLKKDNDIVNSHIADENVDNGNYECLSADVGNLLALHENKSDKWVILNSIHIMPIQYYKKMMEEYMESNN